MEINIKIKLDEEELRILMNGESELDEIEEEMAISQYARFFDENNPHFENSLEHNLLFLKCQQQYANDLLRMKGHVFLNEVYYMLGLKESKEGQLVGWIYDPENPIGDNFIEFEVMNQANLKDGGSILLDFNVDGNIFERL